MQTQLRQGLLFVAGCAFLVLILPLPPDDLEGRTVHAALAHGLVFWLAFYPFAVSTSLPRRDYWLVLVAGLPVAVALQAADVTHPLAQILTLALFAAAFIGLVVQRLSRRKRHGKAR